MCTNEARRLAAGCKHVRVALLDEAGRELQSVAVTAATYELSNLLPGTYTGK